MNTKTKAAAPTNAATITARSAVDHNSTVDLGTMDAQQRQALMAQLKLAMQSDVAPLEERKRELLAELAQLNEQIRAVKPVEDTLAVFRNVRRAVKDGCTSIEEIAVATNCDEGTVEAMLNKHLVGKDDKAPIFIKDAEGYKLNPKTKK